MHSLCTVLIVPVALTFLDLFPESEPDEYTKYGKRGDRRCPGLDGGSLFCLSSLLGYLQWDSWKGNSYLDHKVTRGLSATDNCFPTG